MRLTGPGLRLKIKTKVLLTAAVSLVVFWMVSSTQAFCAQPSVKFLNYNIWQLRYQKFQISKDSPARLRTIVDEIVKLNPDVITLTEAWNTNTKLYLEGAFRSKGYSYFIYRQGNLPNDNGLMLISRYPIDAAEFSKPYRVRTSFTESFAVKGVLEAVITVSQMGPVQVFLTHTGAVAFDKKRDRKKTLQDKKLARQLEELTAFVQLKQKESMPFIVVGDLNFHYQAYAGDLKYKPGIDPRYQAFLNHGCGENRAFENAYLVANHLTVEDVAPITYSMENDYNFKPQYPGDRSKRPGTFLDYHLYCPERGWVPVASEIVLNHKVLLNPPVIEAENHSKVESTSKVIESEPHFLSDHFGVLTTFEKQGSNP